MTHLHQPSGRPVHVPIDEEEWDDDEFEQRQGAHEAGLIDPEWEDLAEFEEDEDTWPVPQEEQ